MSLPCFSLDNRSALPEPNDQHRSGIIMEAALHFHRLRFNVMPCPIGEKSPEGGEKWGHLKTQRLSEADVRKAFEGHSGNLAIIGGKASGNLAIYDAETGPAYEQAKDFILRAHGAKHICGVRSGRGGHLYFRTSHAIRGESHKAMGFEIKAHGGYVLAPPSIHPSGKAYEFDGLWKSLPLIDDWPGCNFVHVPQISRLVRRILSGHKEAIAQYQSRSEVDCAAILGLHQSGFNQQEIVHILRSGKYDSHILRDSAGNDRPEHIIQKDIQRIVNKFGGKGWIGAPLLQTLRLKATAYRWPGRTSTSMQTVYLAHLLSAEKAHRVKNYHASVRDLAKICRMTPTTISKTNRSLISYGFISVAATAVKRNSLASRFTLNPAPAMWDKLDTLTPSSHIVLECAKFVHHSVFEYRGLGRTAGVVYDQLHSPGCGPTTLQDLAKGLGKCIKTIRRALDRLVERKLVLERPEGYSLADPQPDLNEIARTLGVDVKAAQRGSQFHQQRQAHRELVDEMNAKGNCGYGLRICKSPDPSLGPR